MDGRWSASYPEHDRTSCSDSNLFNRDPAGRWCRRCTAIMMDRGKQLIGHYTTNCLIWIIQKKISAELKLSFGRYKRSGTTILSKITKTITIDKTAHTN